jgi:hypothetical protein
LRSRRSKLVQDVESEEWMVSLRKTKRIVSENHIITHFNKDLFSEIVDKAYIEENGNITFLLKIEIECSVTIR